MQTTDLLRMDAAQRAAEVKHDIRRSDLRFAVIMTLFIGYLLLMYWLDTSQPSLPSAPVVTMSNVRVTERADLCPGETLKYSYHLRAHGAGVLEMDATTWRVEPPATIVYSDPLRIVLVGPVTMQGIDEWTVPEFYIDPTTRQQVTWQPGSYERHVSLSTSSRSTTPAIISIPFTIRANCE